jgi:hypothetical protein
MTVYAEMARITSVTELSLSSVTSRHYSTLCAIAVDLLEEYLIILTEDINLSLL